MHIAIAVRMINPLNTPDLHPLLPPPIGGDSHYVDSPYTWTRRVY